MIEHKCIVCEANLLGSAIHRKFCSGRCKATWRRKFGPPKGVKSHNCRNCGKSFSISAQQGNKWLCSIECQRAQNSKHVREFHKRRPLAEAAYRARTKEKMPSDSQNLRFYRNNPDAPRHCESCGESRVTEIAHRPEHKRNGERRSSENMKWPEKVWVLCPTCHRLLDRMNYPPNELGLS